MWKQIYVNGSSFTDGYGLDIPEFLEILNKYNPKYPSHTENEETLIKFRENNSWPGVLESLIDIPVINEAIYGGSFSRVKRKLFRFLNENKLAKDTLYILEVPNATRMDVYNWRTNKWRKVNQGEKDDGSHSDWEKLEINARKHWYLTYGSPSSFYYDDCQNLFWVTSTLKSMGLDYLIIATEQLHYLNEEKEFPDVEEISKTLNKTNKEINFIDFETDRANSHGNAIWSDFPHGYTNNLIVYYQDFLKSTFDIETNGELKDGHPSVEAHSRIAQEIYKNIKNKYIKV